MVPARRYRLGAVSSRTLDLDRLLRLDLGGQRALGLGSVSLGPLVSPRDIRLGMVSRGTAPAPCLAPGLGGVLRIRSCGPDRGLGRVRGDRMVPAGSRRGVRAVVRTPLLRGRKHNPRGQQREHLQRLPERARLPGRFLCQRPRLRTGRPADSEKPADREYPDGSGDSRACARRPGALQPGQVGPSARNGHFGVALATDESPARLARRDDTRVVRIPTGALAEFDRRLPDDLQESGRTRQVRH